MPNIKLLVPAKLSFSAAVRELTIEAASGAGFSEKQKNMIRLVVDELFMNAIRYGSNSESHVFFEVLIEEGKLTCAIEDEGKGEKKVNAEGLKQIIQREKENASLQKVHGRGLAQITSTLVKAYNVSDKENGGIRIEFLIEKQEESPETKTVEQIKEKPHKILPEKVIKISGEIDLNTYEESVEKIEAVFQDHKDIPFRLILDITDVSYCNSTFLGRLAQWEQELEEKGGEFILRNPQENIYEILDLVGLTSIFRIERT